jgi:hypothetical protein
LTALATASITFACAFGSALFGAYLRDRLPAPHLSKESQDVVRLGIGLIATMTALLLGLVTAAARSTFDARDVAIRNTAVNILTLDRHLARYGSETKPTRDLLRGAVAFRVETTWPADGSGRGFGAAMSTPAVEEIENQILHLSPKNETERWFKAEALRLSEEVLKARWRILESGGAIPRMFLVVVTFWLSVTFASFGLYAPASRTPARIARMVATAGCNSRRNDIGPLTLPTRSAQMRASSSSMICRPCRSFTTPPGSSRRCWPPARR